MKYEYIEIKKLLFQERNQTFHRTVFMLPIKQNGRYVNQKYLLPINKFPNKH